MEYSAAVLRNKGVEVEVALLEYDEQGNYTRAQNGEGPKTVKKWVRFDANVIADIEDAYGNLTAFENASRETPTKTVRQALALAWGVSPKEAGAMMLEGRMGDYATAIGAALALANGVDPTQAARLLKIGVIADRRQMAERDKALVAQMDEAEAEAEALVESEQTESSPGTTGSEDGSPSDDSTTTSGD